MPQLRDVVCGELSCLSTPDDRVQRVAMRGNRRVGLLLNDIDFDVGQSLSFTQTSLLFLVRILQIDASDLSTEVSVEIANERCQ